MNGVGLTLDLLLTSHFIRTWALLSWELATAATFNLHDITPQLRPCTNNYTRLDYFIPSVIHKALPTGSLASLFSSRLSEKAAHITVLFTN